MCPTGLIFRMKLGQLALFVTCIALAGCASTNVVFVPPKILSRAVPTYPSELKKAGISGEVVVEFNIESDGSVKKARIVRCSYPAFGQAALTAIYQWKFYPGIMDGRAVPTRAQQSMMFNPNEEPTPPALKTTP